MSYFTPEEEAEIARSMKEFATCEHIWITEPETSNFYYLCQKCGGAQGLRFPA